MVDTSAVFSISLIAVAKILNTKQLKEGMIFVGLYFQVIQCLLAGKARWQKRKAVGHTAFTEKKISGERWMLALFASHSRPLLTLFIQSGIIAQGIVLPTLRVALPILVKSFWKLIDMPVVYLHGDIKASQIVMKMDHPSYDCSTRRLRQEDYERD